MKIYLLEKETIVPGDLQEVWRFFSDPHNLARITPGYLRFRVLRCPDVNEIFEGMLIEYRVSPLLRIPLKWITLIKGVQQGKQFTDTQLDGPYTLWEHTHSFHVTDGGVLMKDRIRYALPLGIFGRMAHTLFIRRQLEALFQYREQQIARLFQP